MNLVIKCFKCREDTVLHHQMRLQKVTQCKQCGHDIIEYIIFSANKDKQSN